ncbi:MAG: hypothetical protein R2851_03255 [Caldilineaceae bacterium]
MALDGVAIVEDVDFRGHFAEPQCPALTRYTDYQSVRNRGADPDRPKLPGHLHQAVSRTFRCSLTIPALHGGIKQLTWHHWRISVVQSCKTI